VEPAAIPAILDNHASTDNAVARVDKHSVMEVALISHQISITAVVVEMPARPDPYAGIRNV
jgi:hypothetical protein